MRPPARLKHTRRLRARSTIPHRQTPSETKEENQLTAKEVLSAVGIFNFDGFPTFLTILAPVVRHTELLEVGRGVLVSDNSINPFRILTIRKTYEKDRMPLCESGGAF